ncbi:maltase A1-like [Agrilus planipennis]|uniref:alpha-glucosidase n=1 Tax=Agrilus planipennis TaxID=224129 RepID=A0A1W4WII3_AGRPL|nr:maltase A1-like [Agrilus planipennis]
MSVLKIVILFTSLLHSLIEAEVIYNGSSTAKDDWWKHTAFYQIYPRSFKDSDGDGLGDLNGIISKLQYLVDAGITATWLSPIFKSPGVDAGYDISDFRDIDEKFGTMSDLERLIKAAHELGIKVILDFVPNHTSDQHVWFQLSKNKTKGYEDYFIWRKGYNSTTPPNNWLSRFDYSAWEYVAERDEYYYHQFNTAQVDLNFRNPKVVQEMKDVLTFWLDKGVDGFRIDAIRFIFEHPDLPDEPLADDYKNYNPYEYNYLNHIYSLDRPESIQMIYQWRELVDNYQKQNGGDTRVLMTEAYSKINLNMLHYGNGTVDGSHFPFNFFIITETRYNSTANEIISPIKKWFQNMPSGRVPNWVLGNHDRDRVATRLGVENVDGYNMLVGLLPGIAVTYNGEEIGMENGEVTWEEGQDPSACNGLESAFKTESRDFERTPFQWDSTVNAGFSTANKTWLPVSSQYKTNNLELQRKNGVKSHFHVYQALLKLRKEDTFFFGNLNIEALDTYVLAFTRELAGNDTYVFIFNKGNYSTTVSLSPFKSIAENVTVVLTSSNSTRNEGDILSRDNVSMDAHEAIVAKSRSKISV